VAQALLDELASARDAYESARRRVVRDRIYLEQRLRGVAGLAVYPSQASYVYVRAPAGIDGAALRDYMLIEHGCLLRDCGNQLGSDSRHFRIAARPAADVDFLVECLDRTFAELGIHPEPEASGQTTGVMWGNAPSVPDHELLPTPPPEVLPTPPLETVPTPPPVTVAAAAPAAPAPEPPPAAIAPVLIAPAEPAVTEPPAAAVAEKAAAPEPKSAAKSEAKPASTPIPPPAAPPSPILFAPVPVAPLRAGRRPVTIAVISLAVLAIAAGAVIAGRSSHSPGGVAVTPAPSTTAAAPPAAPPAREEAPAPPVHNAVADQQAAPQADARADSRADSIDDGKSHRIARSGKGRHKRLHGHLGAHRGQLANH